VDMGWSFNVALGIRDRLVDFDWVGILRLPREGWEWKAGMLRGKGEGFVGGTPTNGVMGIGNGGARDGRTRNGQSAPVNRRNSCQHTFGTVGRAPCRVGCGRKEGGTPAGLKNA